MSRIRCTRTLGRRSLAALEMLESRQLLSANPLISEFMASNRETLLDGNGESSDWIELYNDGDMGADLTGWYLTDDASELTKWQFPATTLDAGGFLVIYASGNDVPDLDGNLHTNFQLSASGDFLALIHADGTTIVSAYTASGQNYPEQYEDISFGAVQETTTTELIGDGSEVDFLIPMDDLLGTTWTDPGFVPDGDWTSGAVPIGFDALDTSGVEPEPVETLFQVDFNDRSRTWFTQSGFSAFNLSGAGTVSTPVTESFGDYDVTVAGATTGFDDRLGPAMPVAGDFNRVLLMQDGIFVPSTDSGAGLDMTVSGLEPNTTHTITVWSYGNGVDGNRVSDWSVNGTLAAADYAFDGTVSPTSNEDYKIDLVATSNAQGELLVQARHDTASVDEIGQPDYGVFLNGMIVSSGDATVDDEGGETPTAGSVVAQIDFNARSGGESGVNDTEAGYQTMNLNENGKTFDDITVTLSAIGGATLDDRDRPNPNDSGQFTLGQVYDDFIFANGTSDGNGLEVLVEGLAANTEYQVKIRSFDTSSTGTRSSSWTDESDGTSRFVGMYTFDGSNPPVDDDADTFVFTAISSDDGHLLLRGVRDGGTSHGVFLNALEIVRPGIQGIITTDIEDQMHEQSASAYLRLPFTMPVDSAIDILSLNMLYDAGFVAYLNGQEVARRNAPTVEGVPPAFDAAATLERPSGDTIATESINLTGFAPLLNDGSNNVLAIHGLNSSAAETDFLVAPALSFTTLGGGAARYFGTPTPGETNENPFLGFVADTTFSVDRGFYDTPFQVEITSATNGAQIYYTVDGSDPAPTNDSATLYTGPIDIDTTTTLRAMGYRDGYLPTNNDTQTYIFLEDVFEQDPLGNPQHGLTYPSVWQANASADFTVDAEVVDQWDDNNPANEDFGIREALKSLPTMSIVMNHDDLWGPAGTGIYTDATRRIEKPGSIEYFDPATGQQFQENVGVRMHGNASRDNVRLKKHSFRLVFSSEFGARKLRFPLFDNSDFDNINTAVLRASFTDAFATRTASGRYSPIDSTYTRDVFMRDSQIAMGGLSADSTFVHLYINGLYWGMYSPAEKADAAFYAAHLGGEPEDWDVLKDFDELDSGNRSAWNAMFSLADELSNAPNPDDIYWELQGMNPDGTDNPSLPNYLDMVSLIDYMILHLSTGPEDWPSHNWHAGRNRVNPGKGFTFQTWDQEIVLDGRYRNRTAVTDKGPARLYSRLQNSEEFLRQFGDRVQLHMFHGGALTVEANQERWMWRADQVEAAIIGESARWGDAREGENVNVPPATTIPTMTVDHWRASIADVRDVQMPEYHRLALEWFREDGLFPVVDAPVFSQHGGSVPAGYQLSMTAAAATITNTEELVALDAPVKAFLPADDSLETGAGPLWHEADFDAAGWIEGTNGVGYENAGDDYASLINTDVGDAWNANPTSLYSRFEFNLDADFVPADVEALELRVRNDDGYVVYLNGQMVYSKNAPENVTWNSRATATRADFLNALIVDTVDLASSLQYLRPGNNVLAIQVLNHSSDLGDLLLQSQLTLTDEVDVQAPIIYTLDGSDPRELGGAVAGTMYDGPIPLSESTQVTARGYIDGLWSPVVQAIFSVIPPGGGIVISEINYNPHDPTAAESQLLPGVGNDDFEFVEVYNSHPTDAINLLGMQLADGVQFTFGDDTLNPGEFAVVVEDAAAFAARYGTDATVLGQWSGGLSNNGETLHLVDAAGDSMMAVQYNDAVPWSARADGAGATLELASLGGTPVERYSKADSWRGSTDFGGSPGVAGTAPLGVVINEVLTHTDPPLTVTDSIELLNTTNEAINIGGWYLSDAAGVLLKFQIPDDTIFGPGEYVVFDESDFNPTPTTPGERDFALSGDNGDDVWLVVPDGQGGVRHFSDDVHFGAALNGVSLGRVNGAGDRLAPLSNTSLGCENAHPSVGPLVVSEVNYAPSEPSAAALAVYPDLTSGDLEFVEIYNPTAAGIDLTDWRVLGGVGHDFDAGTTIDAGEVLVLIRFNPVNPDNADRVSAFRTHFGIDASVRLVGGYSGKLANEGERITLERPDEPPADDPTLTPHVIEDEVLYDNLPPWPTTTAGQSLERLSPVYFGNVSDSWAASVATPGAVAFVPGLAGDLTGDATVDVKDIEFLNAMINRGTTVSAYDLDGSGSVDSADREFLVESILGMFTGDANLDGVVDALDLNTVGVHWQQTGDCLRWSDGNFDGDKDVDVVDLNALGVNWLAGVVSPTRVPQAPLAARAGVVDDAFADLATQSDIVSENESPVAAKHSTTTSQELSFLRRDRWKRIVRRRDITVTGNQVVKDGLRGDSDDTGSLDIIWGNWS